MAARASNKADRIFVKDGRRHYRRRYSATETLIGIGVLVVLGMIVAWVAWRGANPDPTLFMLDTDLSQAGGAEEVARANPNVSGAGATPAVSGAGRGPIPEGVALPGWTGGNVSQFDYDNLYVKINGREGYYKSFGFQRLYFMSIVNDADPQVAVDIELYDLGNAANAVGAYSGERSPSARPEATESGLAHLDRNALFMTRGKHYLRAIGTDESPEVIEQLERLRARFSELPGEPLPWGFALFVGKMGADPGALSYAREDAFSFGFAQNVYSATLDDESELFVTPTPNAEAAAALAAKFRDGFRQYGDAEGDYIKDRYLGTYATATDVGPWVIGVRSAPDPAGAAKSLEALADVVRQFPLPPETAKTAAETTEPTSTEDVEEDYGSDEY